MLPTSHNVFQVQHGVNGPAMVGGVMYYMTEVINRIPFGAPLIMYKDPFSGMTAHTKVTKGWYVKPSDAKEDALRGARVKLEQVIKSIEDIPV